MKKFDVIVIGAGSGLRISSGAASRGKKVAVIEPGPMGGTCLNRGCIPSKMLIHSASVLDEIRNSERFGIKVKGWKINFSKIVRRVNKIVDDDAKSIEKSIRRDKNHTLYKKKARFVGDKIIKVGKSKITADKIFICAGTRPFVPPIKGLEKVKYMTSKQALRLKKLPKSLIIVGGGYISTELAHYFGGLGSKVTIIQRNQRLIPNVDEEIAAKFTEIFSRKYNVVLNHEVVKVKKAGKKVTVYAAKKGSKKMRKFKGDQLLLAVGRKSNTDSLHLKKTGVEMSERGYVKVNKYMETNKPGVWAIGDIAGVYAFKHSANLEADVAFTSAFGKKKAADYRAMPYAIFSNPEVAGVGKTEQQLKQEKIPYRVGRYGYIQTGMGAAIMDTEGFVKFLVGKKSGQILGCHIMGTNASTLIHEVVIAIRSGSGKIDSISNATHIHPALSEVVQRAALNVE